MGKDNKLVSGHDFASHASKNGAKVTSWGGQGPNNYYRVEGPSKESVIFPANNLSKGTRFNLLASFLRMGIIGVVIVLFAALPVLLLAAEGISRGLIK